MKCLIIAAGKGSRLQSIADVKPLIPLKKIPLIERVIDSAMQAEVDDFYVVVGYKGADVRAHLEKVGRSKSISITVIQNKDWEQANGISVLKAEPFLNEPFLLMMADHIFDQPHSHRHQKQEPNELFPVSYTHLTLPTNREV